MSMPGAHVGRIIPQPDDRLGQVVLKSKYAYAGGAQSEKFSTGRFQPEKPGGQHPQHVTAGKYQHIALDRAHAFEHLIGAPPYLRGHFAARAAIAE